MTKTVKVAVVGPSECGKTSLIEVLCGRPFPKHASQMPGQHQTLVYLSEGSLPVKVNFWDTNGLLDETEDEMMRQEAYEGANLIILCMSTVDNSRK